MLVLEIPLRPIFGPLEFLLVLVGFLSLGDRLPQYLPFSFMALIDILRNSWCWHSAFSMMGIRAPDNDQIGRQFRRFHSRFATAIYRCQTLPGTLSESAVNAGTREIGGLENRPDVAGKEIPERKFNCALSTPRSRCGPSPPASAAGPYRSSRRDPTLLRASNYILEPATHCAVRLVSRFAKCFQDGFAAVDRRIMRLPAKRILTLIRDDDELPWRRLLSGPGLRPC